MRFKHLKGLTRLPVDRIRHRFRNEDVLTVLPVRGDIAGRDSLLVATPNKLAIISGDVRPGSDHWMTHLAPWDAVRLGDVEAHTADAADPADPAEADSHRLVVHVDNLTFHAALSGEAGARAVDDFIAAAGAQHEALAQVR